MIEQAFELFIRKAAAQRGIGFEKIEGPMAKDIQIFGRIVGSGTAFIFPELHIKYPMEFVFNPPMAALFFQYLAGSHFLAAIDEVMTLF